MMDVLVPVQQESDIFPQYRSTPIERLLAYHNLGRSFESYTRAEMLIGMCMDHRKHLNIPANFAYIIRTGGGNLRYSEFQVSFALSLGGASAIALIGHTDCGMTNLAAKKEAFIQHMVDDAGWSQAQAEEQFMAFAPLSEIVNPVDFALAEAKRLRQKYPKTLIAPLLYRVEDNQLYLLNEG